MARRPEAYATTLDGNVLWQTNTVSSQYDPTPVQLLPNGHLLVLESRNDGVAPCSDCGSNNLIREVDRAGSTVWELTNAQLQAQLTAAGYQVQLGQMSHDALLLPNGHLIVVISDLRAVPGIAALVEGGGVADLDQNHHVVWVWDSFDHLDVTRHPYFGYPDWVHGNAVIYSPDDGNLVYSARNQAWIIKIDYRNGAGTGNVVWRLGYQGDFSLTNGGPSDWFFAQHAPIFLSPNSTGVFRIGMFDNGNSRVLDATGAMCGTTAQPACYSTVPIFEIDETHRTATLIWRDTLPFFSPTLGNMQILDNGHVWYDAGNVDGQPHAIIREVTMDATPETVFEMDIDTRVYRAVHLPTL